MNDSDERKQAPKARVRQENLTTDKHRHASQNQSFFFKRALHGGTVGVIFNFGYFNEDTLLIEISMGYVGIRRRLCQNR